MEDEELWCPNGECGDAEDLRDEDEMLKSVDEMLFRPSGQEESRPLDESKMKLDNH